MKLIKINERGALTLPKDIRQRLGVARGGTVIVETNEAGEAVLRPGAILPLEIYDAEREAEFASENEAPLDAGRPKWKAKR